MGDAGMNGTSLLATQGALLEDLSRELSSLQDTQIATGLSSTFPPAAAGSSQPLEDSPRTSSRPRTSSPSAISPPHRLEAFDRVIDIGAALRSGSDTLKAGQPETWQQIATVAESET